MTFFIFLDSPRRISSKHDFTLTIFLSYFLIKAFSVMDYVKCFLSLCLFLTCHNGHDGHDLSLCLCLPHSLYLCLSLSVSHSLSLSHSFYLCLSISLTISISVSLSLSSPLFVSLYHSLSLSPKVPFLQRIYGCLLPCFVRIH